MPRAEFNKREVVIAKYNKGEIDYLKCFASGESLFTKSKDEAYICSYGKAYRIKRRLLVDYKEKDGSEYEIKVHVLDKRLSARWEYHFFSKTKSGDYYLIPIQHRDEWLKFVDLDESSPDWEQLIKKYSKYKTEHELEKYVFKRPLVFKE